jgi:hypothetical protein
MYLSLFFRDFFTGVTFIFVALMFGQSYIQPPVAWMSLLPWTLMLITGLMYVAVPIRAVCCACQPRGLINRLEA